MERLVKRYFSTHYERFMPKTREGWEWVIARIELNFGEFFKSIPKDKPILDLACGVGYLEYYLLKEGFLKIYAVDISDEQIRVAKKKLREYGVDFEGRVEFIVSDAFEYLKKGRERYVAITVIDFLEHLQKNRVLELLDLCYKSLLPRGFLFVRTVNADNPLFAHFFYHDFTHETPFTPDSLQQCLIGAGFKVIRIDYEEMPRVRKSLVPDFKRLIHQGKLWLLGRLLGISPRAFAENLVTVARRP